MRLSLITEHRFHRTPEGNVWTATANAYPFWMRYLSVFDEINVTARIFDSPRPLPGAHAVTQHAGTQWTRADGPGVRFSAVPYYVGPYRYALRWLSIRRSLRTAIRNDDAVLMRVPSFLAGCIEPELRRRRQPFGLEVVGDPYDGLAPGGIRHVLRPLLRICAPRQLREQCRRAAGVAYVTKSALQERYPSPGLMVGVSDAVIPATAIADSERVFTTHYSSLSLASGIVSAPRIVVRDGAVRLICVGSLEQFYKGHDVLLRAVAQCVAQGLDLHLSLVGEGRIRPSIEALAAGLGISGRCSFLGQLSEGAAVLKELDRSDVFVLASRTEGLPRAIIEAMARGLPCISTTVGGIPELLPPEDLVPPDNVSALAAKIHEVVDSVPRREQMSRRNVSAACQYVEDVLQLRRTEFYRHIRAVTAAAAEARARAR